MASFRNHHHRDDSCSGGYHHQPGSSSESSVPTIGAAMQSVIPSPSPSSDGRSARSFRRFRRWRWAARATAAAAAVLLAESYVLPSLATFLTAPRPPPRCHLGPARPPRSTSLPFPNGGMMGRIRGFGVLGNSFDDDDSSSSFDESSFSDDSEDGDGGDEDWRAFRAKLVQNERINLAEDREGGVGRDGAGEGNEGDGSTSGVMTVPVTEDEDDRWSSWAYESGDMIERGTVLLHDPPERRRDGEDDHRRGGGFGYGLGRQYLHKSVVLILEAGRDGDGGADLDPTKGVILNRPTDLILSDEDCDERDETCSTETPSFQCRVWYGGPEFGLHTESPKFYCLHALNPTSDVHRRAVLDLSREVLPGVYFATLANAKRLVRMGLAESMRKDFWVFCGFVGWHPGELVDELRGDDEDGDWRALSTDPETVRRGLRVLTAGGGEGSRVDPRDGGIRSWEMLTDMICGGGDDGGGARGGQQRSSDATTPPSFDDLMLREWARENLVFHGDGDISREGRTRVPKFLQEHVEVDDHESPEESPSEAAGEALAGDGAPQRLRPGTLLRGSSNARSPFLLSDQEYHKSVVLLLQDDEDFSVGVLLNRVSARTVDLRFAVVLDDDGARDDGDDACGDDDDDDAALDDILRRSRIRTVSLPVRYGGPLEIVGHPDDDEDVGDDGSDLVFLHVSPHLREAGVGEPIGDSDGAWRCTKGHAMEAMANGIAGPDEFIVVRGFNVWRKDVGAEKGGGGSIGAEVARGNFEVVEPGETTRRVWDALLPHDHPGDHRRPEALTPETIDRILEDAEVAWTAAGGVTEAEGKEPSPVVIAGTRGGAENELASAKYDSALPGRSVGEAERLASGKGDHASILESSAGASSLGDDALKVWVASYLLGDPTLRP